MGLSQTDICNQALARVGAKLVMSINDGDSKGARACLNAYDATVNEVARSGTWNCLTKRAQLARLVTVPAFEWAYQYQLPVDLMLLLELNGVEYHGEPQDEWVIEGRLLLTDAETALVRYVALITDTTQWDALFTNAVVVLLAAKIAVPIRQDEQLMTALMGEYQRVLGNARMRDGNEGRRHRWNPTLQSRWVNARYGSTNDGDV
jgi:hypothetical protein